MRKILVISLVIFFMVSQFSIGSACDDSTKVATLAFVRDGDVWLMAADGSGVKQITTEGVYKAVEWSPDGSLISALRTDNQIDLVNPATQEIFNIRYDGGVSNLIIHPAWSPDSQFIAFSSYEIYVFNRVGEKTGEFKEMLVSKVAWGKDSQTLYFGADLSFWKLNITSGEKEPLYTTDSSTFYDTQEVSVSPSDSSIAAWAASDAGNGDLYFFTQGGNKTIHGGQPTGDWSPDGTQYVFQTGNIAFAQSKPISIYNIQDGSTTILYDQGGLNPRWSPDGTRIAFTTWKGGLVLIDPATKESQTILSDAPQENLFKYRSQGGPDAKTIGYFATPDMTPTWSPDGKQLTFTYPKGFFVIETETGKSQWYENSSSPQWQPTSPITNVNITELLQTKRTIIPELTTITYTFFYDKVEAPIQAYNEDKAIELLNKLDGNPQDISPEQAAAFSRLVMQEKTLAQTLRDYSVLSNDSADAQVDFASISTGFFLALKAMVNPPSALGDLAQKTFEDYLKLWTWQIRDPEMRSSVQNGISGASDTISSKTVIGAGETFLNVVMDVDVRAEAAKDNLTLLTGKVQPTIDQYIEITDAAGGGISVVDNTDQMAQLQLDHIMFVSAIWRETAHSQYEQLAYGRDFNELFFKDIADIISVGSKNPVPLLISVWTRIQQSLIDGFAIHLLGNSMDCISRVSERAGALAFHPEQQLVSCDDPSKIQPFDDGPAAWVDGPAWQQAKDRLVLALQDYGVKTNAVQAAVEKGDAQQIEKATADLSKSQQTVDELTTLTIGLLTPPEDQLGTTDTITIAQKIVEMEMNMVGLQLGIAAYASEPGSAEAAASVLSYAPRVSSSIGEINQSLEASGAFGNNSSFGIAYILSAPYEVQGYSGSPLTIKIKLGNIGSQKLAGATITGTIQSKAINILSVPSIEPGQSVDVEFSYTPAEEGNYILTLQTDDGIRTDFKRIHLTIQQGPPPPIYTPTVQVTETPVLESTPTIAPAVTSETALQPTPTSSKAKGFLNTPLIWIALLVCGLIILMAGFAVIIARKKH